MIEEILLYTTKSSQLPKVIKINTIFIIPSLTENYGFFVRINSVFFSKHINFSFRSHSANRNNMKSCSLFVL